MRNEPKLQRQRTRSKMRGRLVEKRVQCTLQFTATRHPTPTHPHHPSLQMGSVLGGFQRIFLSSFQQCQEFTDTRQQQSSRYYIFYLFIFSSFMAEKSNLSFCLSGFRGEKLCESLWEILQSRRGLLLNEHIVLIWMLFPSFVILPDSLSFFAFFWTHWFSAEVEFKLGIQAWVARCNFSTFFLGKPKNSRS